MKNVREYASVLGAKGFSRRKRRSPGYSDEAVELRRQTNGWVVSLMQAGLTENQARRIASAVVYGPLVSFVVWGLMSSTQ